MSWTSSENILNITKFILERSLMNGGGKKKLWKVIQVLLYLRDFLIEGDLTNVENRLEPFPTAQNFLNIRDFIMEGTLLHRKCEKALARMSQWFSFDL